MHLPKRQISQLTYIFSMDQGVSQGFNSGPGYGAPQPGFGGAPQPGGFPQPQAGGYPQQPGYGGAPPQQSFGGPPPPSQQNMYGGPGFGGAPPQQPPVSNAPGYPQPGGYGAPAAAQPGYGPPQSQPQSYVSLRDRYLYVINIYASFVLKSKKYICKFCYYSWKCLVQL